MSGPAPATVELVEPTVSELRLLRPTSLRLWGALVRLRDRKRAPQGEWMLEDLAHLARLAKIASYDTARSALAELRRAGLVATDRHYITRWRPAHGEVNAAERLFYSISGTIRTRAGVAELRFPSTWKQYVDRCAVKRATATVPAPAGTYPESQAFTPGWIDRLHIANMKRELRVDAKLNRRPGRRRPFSILPREVGSLGQHPYRSNLPERIGTFFSSKEEKKAGDRQFFSSCSERRSISKTPPKDWRVVDHDPDSNPIGLTPVTSLLMSLLDPRSPRPRPPEPVGPPPVWLPMDPPQAAPSQVIWLSETMPELNRVMLLIDSYGRAVKKIYGKAWWNPDRGDPRASRWYKSLAKCSVEMMDHAVSPEHWAIWQLAFFRDKRGVKRAPSINMVMSPKRVAKMAGFFRKDYVLPAESHLITREHHEQLCRNQEAHLRWKWCGDEARVWQVLPSWYAKMRRDEARRGYGDPHAMYTRINQNQAAHSWGVAKKWVDL